MTDTLLKTLQLSLDDPMDHVEMPKRVLRAVIERLAVRPDALELADKPDEQAGAKRRAEQLWDWLQGFLEEECSLDPSCLSKGDRSNLINGIFNTLTLPRAAPQPETEEAMFMLQDVPGDTLVERVARLSKWYLELKTASQPETAGVRDEHLWGRFVNHYWDSLEWEKDIVLLHIKAVLDYHAANPSPDTRSYADRAQSATAFDPELQADGDAEKRT